METDNIKNIRNRLVLINWTIILFVVPPIIVALILFLPIIGNAAVLSLAGELGCTVNSASSHPCYLFGHDIGEIVYGYLVSALTLGMLNPVLLLIVVFELPVIITVPWALLFVLLVVARSNLKSRLELANNSFKPNPLRGSA